MIVQSLPRLSRYLCACLVMMSFTSLPAQSEESSVAEGKYFARLLGCEGCHTHGYLTNEPKKGKPFTGSRVGLGFWVKSDEPPAIVFPPNLTPDKETGLGAWSKEEIVAAMTGGVDRHGKILWPAMPWASLAELRRKDAESIADYLMSLPPVKHKVPDNVPAGEASDEKYIGLNNEFESD